MQTKNNDCLSSSNATVYALDNTEVVKFLNPYSAKAVKWEVERLVYANGINDLFAKFKRVERINGVEAIVMERLYSVCPGDFSNTEKRHFIDKLEDEIIELHKYGIVHGDLVDSSLPYYGRTQRGLVFNKYNEKQRLLPCTNVFITKDGFRIIDAGHSTLLEDTDTQTFNLLVEEEMNAICKLKSYVMMIEDEYYKESNITH